MKSLSIPQPVQNILQALNESGFEAYAVGGCVRDLLLDRTPKDWDITTNALPEQIQVIFPDSFYENTFGTVGVKVERFSAKSRGDQGSETTDPFAGVTDTEATSEKEIIEVTTYRTEADYSDSRHPDTIHFTTSLEEDLARRDFTINAMALKINTGDSATKEAYEIVDPFHGQEDLTHKIIRAVGDPNTRFTEDALRLMRAIRFWAELAIPSTLTQAEPLFDVVVTNAPPSPIIHNLSTPVSSASGTNNWLIEEKTLQALKENAPRIAKVSWERIRDEFTKIIMSPNPAEGVHLLTTTRLIHHILPELEEGLGVGQNLHHVYTVYEHNFRALKTCPSTKLSVRLAALLHDVGKPRTKRGNGHYSTFYNHDHVGARMTRPILTRLRFPVAVIDHATLLVDNHLFYYNVDEVTAASVRRLIARVGLENIPDLIHVRIGDRLGSGTPKAKPYRLRHFEYMVDKVSHDAVSVKMLKVNGKDLMEKLSLTPGPKIGAILDVLLAETIEDATLNDTERLLARARELDKENLEKLRGMAKEKIDEKRKSDTQAIKQKHWVQ